MLPSSVVFPRAFAFIVRASVLWSISSTCAPVAIKSSAMASVLPQMWLCRMTPPAFSSSTIFFSCFHGYFR